MEEADFDDLDDLEAMILPLLYQGSIVVDVEQDE